MARTWVFGDNINTDNIIPGRFNLTTDRRELAKHIFEYIRPEFAKGVRAGDVIVAGKNFGCGSSREHAVTGLKACGVHLVAESYGWIFQRNCIANGLLPLQISQPFRGKDGDSVELDAKALVLRDLRGGEVYTIREFPKFVLEIVGAGGLVSYLDTRGGYSL